MALSVVLDPAHVRELRRRAVAETKARGGTRPDVSAALRAVLDKALKLKPQK